MHFVRAPLFFAATLYLALNYNGALADFAEGLEAYDGGDYEAAVANWQDDVEAGNVEAMTALAELYTRGTGVPQSWPSISEALHTSPANACSAATADIDCVKKRDSRRDETNGNENRIKETELNSHARSKKWSFNSLCGGMDRPILDR